MGFYDYDNKDLYKTRVTDITVDKLSGVPSNSTGQPTAINQGVAQVRCFIHPYCPFVKQQREEIHLTLNDLTLPVVVKNLPDRYKNMLTTSFGTEGIHFAEKYVYRHNFLVIDSPDLKDAETAYEDILGPHFIGLADTRYKEEQSWIVRKSVFDDTVALEGCDHKATWAYQYPNLSSSYSHRDELLDYKKDFYRTYSKYANPNNPGIHKSDVQMPSQITSSTCNGTGVHWRVEKRTPLFKGEDFFIEFHKLSKSSNSGARFLAGEEFGEEFNTGDYGAIDVFNSEPSQKVTLLGKDVYTIHKNSAVLEGEIDSNPRRRARRPDAKWRLFDQAYYIIEMGDETSTGEHYFIIICERAYPIFVTIRDYDVSKTKVFKYSEILSTFNEQLGGVHGSSLIKADTFRMTVRNHLGKLVIFFDVDGERSNNWIVEKLELSSVDVELKKIESQFKDVAPTENVVKNEILTVPNNKINIWGGNIQSGFVFGPLQYARSDIYFKWEQNIILPINQYNSGRLTVTENYVHDIEKFSSTPGSPPNSESLFSQGCHFYKGWGESRNKDINKTLNTLYQGRFMYNPSPLIEQTSYRKAAGARDVEIELFNPDDVGLTEDVLVDEKLGKVSFAQNIFMSAGSHIFDGENESISGWRSKVIWKRPTVDNIEDDLWVVDACKTPIMTNIRFVSEESKEPRWKDGTDSSGYSGTPNASDFSSPSPFFRDVSHHVLSYSDNWSANDFYEMEHSGAIDFLLKEVAVDVNGSGTSLVWDDSSYIKSLQNKAFYIEVWAGYEPFNTGKEYTQLGGFYKMFTGVCYGGNLDKTAARETMTCQIHDYKRVLQDQKFFNSPFYDGVRDIDAVKEIFDIAGFRDTGSHDPASLLKFIQSNAGSSENYTAVDGRPFQYKHFALPSSYRRIEQPYFKFAVGTSLYDGIIKIAQSASKLFYFDQNGVAHFEDYLDLVQKSLVDNGRVPILFDFTTNFYEYPGQLIYNKLEWQYRVEDIYNHLKVTTGTPDLDLVSRNDINLSSLDTPNSPGFLGYKKLFYQREGMLGSEGATKALMDFYKVMFLPELLVKFETMGTPLRATDFITVDGQILRVSKVSHEIDGEKNLWWMNVEGEKMQNVQ